MAIVETLRELSDVGTFKEGKHARTELVEHLDQRRAVDVLSAVQEELEEWEIVDEQYQIAKVESEDQEVLEETQTARNQALDQLVRGVVERALLPAARRYLNRSAEIDESSALSQVTASGLHQLLPRDFELQTEAATSVSRIIDQQRTAAIGIAGARGSGKTTLIEWFTRDQSRGSRPHRYALSPERRVFVTAPVQYDTRDFLLHLFAEVCQAVLGRRHTPRFLPEDHDRPRKIAVRTARTLYSLLLRALLLVSGLATAYMAYLLLVEFGELPLPLAAVKQALAMAILGWISFNLALAANTLRADGLPFFVILHHLRRPDRPLLLLTVLAAVGSGLVPFYALRYGQYISDRAMFLIAGSCTAILSLIAAWRAFKWQRAHQPGLLDGWSTTTTLARSKSKLQRRAESYLDEIRFQQTFTSGWGGKVTATSQVLSAEISNTEGVTFARSAWTLPETVRNLREILAEAAVGSAAFVVGIDEVDKIEDVVAARRFIDDIKAVFHVPNCFFLVSVSDDAVASFETRGLPFRDAFDSAFDEVVRIEYGKLDASRDVLAGRVVGLPIVFVALCHALAGGLPRDLLRVTRFMPSLSGTNFSEIYPPMIQRELLGKIPALLRKLVSLDAPAVFLAVSWAERAALDWADVAELHSRLAEFRKVIDRVSRDPTIPPEVKGSTLRSCSEAEVIFYLACTLLEYCAAIDGPKIPVQASEKLSLFAVARQKIAIHPAIAAMSLNDLREGESLAKLDLWTTSSA